MDIGQDGDSQLRRSGWFCADDSARRPLRLGYDARLDGRAVIDRIARELPPKAADLIEIAAMAYAADRLAPRRADSDAADGSGWSRRLWLQIPVRVPRLWTSVTEHLTEFLGWLTHDDWTLEFRELPIGGGTLDTAQGFLFHMVPHSSSPALFSGGLDSALGLARDVREFDPIAVSVHTNNRMQGVQRHLFRQITGARTRGVHLQYHVSLQEPDRESSQRTRGLLFLAAGIGTAWALGQDCLRVFENGIGAINLPYLRSQFGPQATRSMHPRTLWLAERLASAVSGRPFRIDAPFLTCTKAEAVRSVPEISTPIAAATVSCDTGFAARVTGISHCGACTSCLLRRQALIAADQSGADAATAYRNRAPAGTDDLSAVAWQLDRLAAALAEPDPWHGLVAEFPSVLDVGPLTPAEVISLYRAYVQEWEAVGPVLGLRRHDRSAA